MKKKIILFIFATIFLAGCNSQKENNGNTQQMGTLKPSEKAIMDENGNTVPEGCKVWFDGCNTCHVNANGIMVCTRKLCNPNALQQAHCVDDK